MSDAQREEMHDRLVDLALREAIGGESPPDLTGRILEAHAADGKHALARPHGAAHRFLWARLALAACVLLCVGLLVWPKMQAARESVRADNASTRVAQRSQADNRASQERMRRQLDRDTSSLTTDERARVGRLMSERREVSGESLSRGDSIDSRETNGDGVPRYFENVDLDADAPADGGYQLSDGMLYMQAGDSPTPVPPSASASIATSPATPSLSSDLYSLAPTSEAAPGAPPVAAPPSNRHFSSSDDSDAMGRPQRSNWGYASGGGRRADVRFRESKEDSFSFNDLPNEVRLKQQWMWYEKPHVAGQGPGLSGDRYDRIHENPFVEAKGMQAVSTFSIDVDTASYANVRQFLTSGRLPPADAVRLEELINYFDYGYEPPTRNSGEEPFTTDVEVAGCPWAPAHRVVRIGVKGREAPLAQRPLTNLVFLIDVSGSMQDANKLPLVREGMKALVRQLGENDRVSIVVYASSEGVVLPSTPGDEQQKILSALDGLTAGGSTAGGAGIQLAYQLAEDNKITGGVNRVILCTDGDFNVGTTSTGELERLVQQKAQQTGVFLSVCGIGRGNLNDAMMETISNRGNGVYYYIDGPAEAERVFVKGLTGTLVTIAKDVKIQVEFNPSRVSGYRLLGYENRMLKAQDFNDDKRDAGEIGAGHTVTALYEIVPAGSPVPSPNIDDLKYQQPPAADAAAYTGELLTLKMRYKLPDQDASTKREWPVVDDGRTFAAASADLQWATGVAGFGMLLRGSDHAGNLTWDAVREIAQGAAGAGDTGQRQQFLELVERAQRLSGDGRQGH